MPDKTHTSIVLVGNNHNPTVVTTDFVFEEKIFDKKKVELDRSKILISQPYSQIIDKNGAGIKVFPDKFEAFSTDPEFVINAVVNYTNGLKYIMCNAIGINSHFENIDKSINDIITLNPQTELTVTEVLLVEKLDERTDLNLKISKRKDLDTVDLAFNFHTRIDRKPQKELNFNFEKKYQEFNDIIISKFHELDIK